jgi:hypothetical protein
MGIMANELSLGCDCLGQIHYLVSGCIFHFISKSNLIQNDFSLAPLFHMMAVLSSSGMSYVSTKRIMASFGSTLITGPMAGKRS